jgi:hypothetical protein
MQMSSRALLIRDAVIALIVGTTIGTAAGLWSTRDEAAAHQGAPAPAIEPRPSRESTAVSGTVGVRPMSRANARPGASSVAPGRRGATASAPAAVGEPTRAVHRPAVAAEPGSATAGQSPTATNPEAELSRARLLAQRADVNGLIAIRERAARRAQKAGAQESAAAKQHLEQLDRYLTEARTLRLTLDAQEFRKASDKR